MYDSWDFDFIDENGNLSGRASGESLAVVVAEVASEVVHYTCDAVRLEVYGVTDGARTLVSQTEI